jgi:hypothetical protein
MKRQIIRINYIVIVLFLTIIFNVNDLRCQENSNMINNQYQSNNMELSNREGSGDDVKDDKNIRIEILDLIIRHNLFYQYQKLDPEELEDRLVRRSKIGGE